jgi:hypothetical protein
MEHLGGWETAKLKREMISELENLEKKPYVQLRKVEAHRWGSMRVWPKWKGLRRLWGTGETAPLVSWAEGAEKVEEALKNLGEEGRAEEVLKSWSGGPKRRQEEDECNKCTGSGTHQGWDQVAWRPVISYSRHHLRGLLSLAGKWSIFVITVLELGLHVGSARHVTEKVHAFNGGARTHEEYATRKRAENEERARKVRKDRRARKRFPPLAEQRGLDMKILDLAKFFIKVPRTEFYEEVLPEILRRVEERFGNKRFF